MTVAGFPSSEEFRNRPKTDTLVGMRWPLIVAASVILAGIALAIRAHGLSFYTDPDAPVRISDALYPSDKIGNSKEIDRRYQEWYAQLRYFETPRKKLSDMGRGLCAAGLGLLAGAGYWRSYHEYASVRTQRTLLVIWLSLWSVRIPLTIWYYTVREDRFDYPVWGDSIAIPIFSESLSWIVGGIVTSVVLAMLLYRRRLPERIEITKAGMVQEWPRSLLILGWIVFLAIGVTEGIPDGDEGTVMICTIASAILAVVLAAQKIEVARTAETAPPLPG